MPIHNKIGDQINMKNYEKIPFNEINNIESYVEDKLKNGYVIIQVNINEIRNEIDELITYANDKECESYYRSLTDSDEQLKTCVITERLEPYYAFKGKNRDKNSCCDIDIKTDDQNVIDFDTFKDDFKDMSEYYDEHSFQYEEYLGKEHYEFYISTGKGDIENFGGSMEADFITEWMVEHGYHNQ